LALGLQAGTPRSLKIASWNVENLFDVQRQGTEYPEYLPGRRWNEGLLRHKLQNLSQVICDLDADVIALQEVENDGVLARLQSFLKRVGCPYPFRAITTGAGRPVHVALLSRVPIARKREIPITPMGRERRILEVTLATEPPLTLFVNHWRSKRGPESDRVRYARALKRRLMRLPAGTEYLLLGDFNSDLQEYRIMDRKHNDTGGITGINHVLGTLDARGRLIRPGTLRGLGGFHHRNLWLDLESARRWSHNFFGDKEAIDAILIPPSLVDGRGWEYRPGSFGVFRPRYLFGPHGEVKRWEIRHGVFRRGGYSDHLPIYARFDRLPPKKGTKGSLTQGHQAIPQEKALDIAALQRLEALKEPVKLEGAVLVFKRGRHGVFQQRPEGPAILLYGAAAGLEEGRRYDVLVHGFKRYHGMPEITDLELLNAGKRVETDPYIPPFHSGMMARPSDRYRVVRGIRGVFRGGKLLVEGRAIPIHFKKRRWRPPPGSELRIKRAQIGYYKGRTELVVWDRSDFEIVRK